MDRQVPSLALRNTFRPDHQDGILCHWPVKVWWDLLTTNLLGWTPHLTFLKSLQMGAPCMCPTDGCICTRRMVTSYPPYSYWRRYGDIDEQMVLMVESLGPINLYVFSTYASLYGNSLHYTPKDHTPRSSLPYIGRKTQDLGVLTPNLLYKEKPYIQGILVSFTPLYKH